MALPRRLLLLLPLAGCTNEPEAHLGGFGDPVRAAGLNAPRLLGDTSRLAGNPALAARGAVMLELLHEAFRNDPRYAPTASIEILNATRLGRAEMRDAIGIAQDAPAEQVMAQLRDAATALENGSPARAEAALSSPIFPLGGPETLRRLGNLPSLRRVSQAASAANLAVQVPR